MPTCSKCERGLTRKNKHPDDPDFCRTCFDEVERLCAEPMVHARAAAALCNVGNLNPAEHEALKMHAFLSIFHPRMSDRKKRALVADVRAANG